MVQIIVLIWDFFPVLKWLNFVCDMNNKTKLLNNFSFFHNCNLEIPWTKWLSREMFALNSMVLPEWFLTQNMEESDRQHGTGDAAWLEELTHKETTHADTQSVYKPGMYLSWFNMEVALTMSVQWTFWECWCIKIVKGFTKQRVQKIPSVTTDQC